MRIMSQMDTDAQLRPPSETEASRQRLCLVSLVRTQGWENLGEGGFMGAGRAWIEGKLKECMDT